MRILALLGAIFVLLACGATLMAASITLASGTSAKNIAGRRVLLRLAEDVHDDGPPVR